MQQQPVLTVQFEQRKRSDASRMLPSSSGYTVKKRLSTFPSPPAGMSLIKLSLGGNNLKGKGKVWYKISDIPAGDENVANL